MATGRFPQETRVTALSIFTVNKVASFAGRYPNVMEVCKTVIPTDIIVDEVLVKCHLCEGEK
jgi:hypothetical protein